MEEGRLRKLASDMEDGDFRMNANEVRERARYFGMMAISLDCLATHVRDRRGAQPQTPNEG